MTEEKFKIENQKWDLMKKPIAFASSAFILSILFNNAFTIIIKIILKFLNMFNINISQILVNLNKIPPSFFDGCLYIVAILYTFNFKEKMSFFQILKISIWFAFFVTIRTFIIWNFTIHSNQPFYLMLDLFFTVLSLIILFFLNLVGLKITNILTLKWLEKIKERTNY